jgi:hypothetical protein
MLDNKESVFKKTIGVNIKIDDNVAKRDLENAKIGFSSIYFDIDKYLNYYSPQIKFGYLIEGNLDLASYINHFSGCGYCSYLTGYDKYDIINNLKKFYIDKLNEAYSKIDKEERYLITPFLTTRTLKPYNRWDHFIKCFNFVNSKLPNSEISVSAIISNAKKETSLQSITESLFNYYYQNSYHV